MTSILFPILTFSLVFIFGITCGIFIATLLERKIILKKHKDLDDHLNYQDNNGNIIKMPVQNNTMMDHIQFNTKTKLNKYEMAFLIQNIQNHLDNIGETPEENEHVQDLFKNLIKKNRNEN